ncbi:MAG: energy transducer TonB [Planctomycetota bacterium]
MRVRHGTRLLQRRQHGRRVALAVIIGVAAAALLIAGLARVGLSDHPAALSITSQRVTVEPLPPPPVQVPQAATSAQSAPSSPAMPAMPALTLPIPDAAPLLPQGPLQSDADLPLGSLAHPVVVVAPEVTRARPARRLFTPDLRHHYPRRAAARGISGTTLATLVIDDQGAVVTVNIISSTPPGVFDHAAQRALQAVRYQPACDAAGKPIASERQETLRWQLD